MKTFLTTGMIAGAALLIGSMAVAQNTGTTGTSTGTGTSTTGSTGMDANGVPMRNTATGNSTMDANTGRMQSGTMDSTTTSRASTDAEDANNAVAMNSGARSARETGTSTGNGSNWRSGERG